MWVALLHADAAQAHLESSVAQPEEARAERRSPEENLRARAPVRDGVPRSGEGEGEANLMCSSCALRAARAVQVAHQDLVVGPG